MNTSIVQQEVGGHQTVPLLLHTLQFLRPHLAPVFIVGVFLRTNVHSPARARASDVKRFLPVAFVALEALLGIHFQTA